MELGKKQSVEALRGVDKEVIRIYDQNTLYTCIKFSKKTKIIHHSKREK